MQPLERAQLVSTAGHPVVWARNKQQPGRRTVMVYGHYDVQPPDPLELWDSPPFDPVLRNGHVFARGATDNKGQILAHILGIQETLEERGDLGINLHLVIEGEEEIGSGNLPGFLEQNRDSLGCDVALVSDTGMIAARTPTLSYGLRGVTALEVKLTGAKMDLHSGVFGGAVANPITALARLLATLHDHDGHVAVAGFYDKVKPLEDWERKAWRKLPIDGDEAILDELGIADRAKTYPGALSGGERQRVGVARALMNRPALLLADEPTGALDSASAAGVRDLLTKLNRAGQTVLLVTHDRAFAAASATRTVELVDGRISADTVAAAR